jgi:hypothetical protein
MLDSIHYQESRHYCHYRTSATKAGQHATPAPPTSPSLRHLAVRYDAARCLQSSDTD